MLQRELLYAAIGTGCTCLATVLGAAMVFFFKREMSAVTQKVFLGFAAGVICAQTSCRFVSPHPCSRHPRAVQPCYRWERRSHGLPSRHERQWR